MLEIINKIADKLKVTTSEAEVYLRIEGERLLQLAEDNIHLAKTHLETTVVSAAKFIEDEVKETEGEINIET